jgi:hypothetical protein
VGAVDVRQVMLIGMEQLVFNVFPEKVVHLVRNVNQTDVYPGVTMIQTVEQENIAQLVHVFHAPQENVLRALQAFHIGTEQTNALNVINLQIAVEPDSHV